MKTSDKGIELIKEFEGLSLTAYPDPGTGGEPWTIGYGTTIYPCGEPVRPGDTVTAEEAEECLMHDLPEFESVVSEATEVKLNQNQFDALVSLTYNVGDYAFQTSTLLRVLNRGNYEGAAQQFRRWVYSKGRKLSGLVKRREREKNLFMS